MIGTQIGNYRIVEKLGEGGMGVVYKAVEISLDRAVAVKVLSPDLAGDQALIERFRSEAKAQANLNHPNIATLYTFLTTPQSSMMVMEFLEGETFDQLIRRRGLLPYEQAVPIFKQALLGIGFAHRQGIVHRDIKPSNIMLTKSGLVKVMDFGIAKVLGGQRLTQTGSRMGTVYYMSPEQIRNRAVEIRSDIYALGVTLYEMLTAHLPFESDSDFEIMSNHVNTPPPRPTIHYPYIPPGIEQAVLKALEKDPNARFQTVEEFGAALEHPEGAAVQVPQAMGTAAGVAPAVEARPQFATQAPAAVPVTTPPQMTRMDTPPAQGYATGQGYPQAYPTTPPVAPATVPPAAAATGDFFSQRRNLILIGIGVVALILLGAIISYQLTNKKPAPVALGSNRAPQGESALAAGGAKSPLTLGQPQSNMESQLQSPQQPPSPPPQPATPAPAAPPAWKSAHESAQRALNSGAYLPAITEARRARAEGDPNAHLLEQQALNGLLGGVQASRQAHDYASALVKVSNLINLFPNRPDLLQLRQAILQEQQQYAQQQLEEQRRAEQQRQKQAVEASFQRFNVTHRHVVMGQDGKIYNFACQGILSVSPNGTVQYDCQRTNDPQGRCDHVTWVQGAIRQAKISRDGSLHLATSSGNFDMYGNTGDIQQAVAAISPLATGHK